jgi:glycosyltransferase involved in cell wall biosynthesis
MRQLCRYNVDALHAYPGRKLSNILRNWLRRCVRLVDRVIKRFGAPPVEEIVSWLLGRAITPIILDYWKRYPPGLDDFVAELAARHSWDAVIIEYIWLYPAAQKLKHGVLRLLDTHDIQHKRVDEFASRGMTFPLRITGELESSIFKKFDAVLAIQALEAAAIRSMCPQATVLTVGSRVSDAGEQHCSTVDGRILYIGGFNGANIDGLRRFLRRIWPKVLEQQPLAHLHVCGYVYRAFLGEAFAGVKFLGHLEDTDGEYAQAAVVINPSWIGTGLKIKTIEALAHGKPLVTTPKGVEGLDSEVRKSAVICNVDCEFAASMINLLRDSRERRRLSEAAKRFAHRHLNIGAVYGELLAYLDERRAVPRAHRHA